MSALKDDPEMGPVLSELESGGPAAMMKCVAAAAAAATASTATAIIALLYSYTHTHKHIQVLERP
jgi:hypothetical protein